MKKLLKWVFPVILSILPSWGADRFEIQDRYGCKSTKCVKSYDKPIEDLDKGLNHLSVSLPKETSENKRQEGQPVVMHMQQQAPAIQPPAPPSDDVPLKEQVEESALSPSMQRTLERVSSIRRLREIKISLESQMIENGQKYAELKKSEIAIRQLIVKLPFEEPTPEYIKQYIDDETHYMRECLTDESFIDNIQSKMNLGLARGSKARAKYLKEYRTEIQSKIVKIEFYARMDAMKYFQLRKIREIEDSQLRLRSIISDKEAIIQDQAELIKLHDSTVVGLENMGAIEND